MGSLSKLSGLMKRFPMLTTSIQAGTLMCAGDLISQKFVEKKTTSNIDLMRTVRFGLVGFIIVGPVLKTWYGFLDRAKFLVMKSPVTTAMAKMATDQLVLAPLFCLNFIPLMGFLNGHSVDEVKTDIKNNYLDIMIRNYQLWPAAQMINFSVIPLQHRVLFAQSVALIWNTYLSFKTNRDINDIQAQSDNKPLLL